MKVPRKQHRKKILLAANLCIGDSSMQCRIRNVTELGALIECDLTVPVGTTVIIERGALSVAGEARWSRNNQLGVEFSTLIHIQDWLTEVALVSNLPPPRPTVRQDETDLNDRIIDRRISEELLYVSRIVEEIGELLVKDPLLRVRHAKSLQQLDMGRQMLSEIAQIIPIDGKSKIISQAATGPMRGRLLRSNPI